MPNSPARTTHPHYLLSPPALSTTGRLTGDSPSPVGAYYSFETPIVFAPPDLLSVTASPAALLGFYRHGFNAHQLEPQPVYAVEHDEDVRLVLHHRCEGRPPACRLHLHPFEDRGVALAWLSVHHYPVGCSGAHVEPLRGNGSSRKSPRGNSPVGDESLPVAEVDCHTRETSSAGYAKATCHCRRGRSRVSKEEPFGAVRRADHRDPQSQSDTLKERKVGRSTHPTGPWRTQWACGRFGRSQGSGGQARPAHLRRRHDVRGGRL